MDKIDLKIIRLLQENGRLTNQDLAEAVNLSPSPCLRRTRALEASGVIKGYAAIVDEKAFGLPITVFVQIRLSEHTGPAVQAFEAKIRDIDRILDCYVVTGSDDYILRVLTRDLADYERFVRESLHCIPGIASIDTSFAYGTVKRSMILPQPGLS
ncbi:Lrp/AsnC family transcriptional regulator [Epibacterium ulvae]|uniref:Lrp/AsnC family transcriptional regulator n=1 Tax=Epibacterium ulvae TaxID=1156985 RepID=UPI0024911CBC|nr:Lrp/AsnC family transcriptional regulator [Epibacterium ulvae]